MSEIVFFDGTDEHVADLDDHLRAQFGPYERVESLPLFTTIVADTALTIIRVTHKARTRHQLYAITDDTWTLTAIYGLYTDAMSELLRWRRYLAQGGTVAAWQHAHPDGVRPERSGFPEKVKADSPEAINPVERRSAPQSAKNRGKSAILPRSPMQPLAVTAISNGTNRSLLDRKTAAQDQSSEGMPVSGIPVPPPSAPIASTSSGPNAAWPNLLHSAHAGFQLPVSYSKVGSTAIGTT